MMINISKFVAIVCVLLYGINANHQQGDVSTHGVSNWDTYLTKFYQMQNEVALCKEARDCWYLKNNYLDYYFNDECNICIPQRIYDGDDILCHDKSSYKMILNEFYQEMKDIIKWDIKDIDVSDYPYGYNKDEKVYKVTAKLDLEYIYGQCKV